MQVSVAMCDYQLELSLISYNNSARSLENGRCCDSNTLTMCSVQDTCDIQFTFSVENINTVGQLLVIRIRSLEHMKIVM